MTNFDMSLPELERLRLDPLVGAGKLPVIARRQHERDAPFIMDGWLRSYENAKAVSGIPRETYFHWHQVTIQGLWFDPTAAWIVACDPDRPGQCFGFIVGQRAETLAGSVPVLHYCYVKPQYRRLGLASRLLATFDQRTPLEDGKMPPMVVTHNTDHLRRWFRAIDQVALYNPYLFLARAPAPQPQLKGYDGRRGRRNRDPEVVARRNPGFHGYRPTTEEK